MVVESIGYSSWVYVGSGFWVTVVIHIADCDVEASGCEVVRKLGSSKKQVAYKTPFMPMCGVSFRVADFDRIVDKHGGKILNFAYLSKEIKPGQWTDADSWHSLFEVSPIDFKSFACRGMMISSSQLSVQLKVGESRPGDDEMEDDEQAASAGALPADMAPPAAPAPVPPDALWVPEYNLDQETSKPAGVYATLEEIGNDCCFLMLKPTFDKVPVSIAESSSQNMPRANPMTVMNQAFGDIWTKWSTIMRHILIRAVPGVITRYGTDKNGKFFTPEQVNDIRTRLGLKAWTVQEVFCFMEALSPLLALRVASTLAYGAVPPLYNPSTIHEIYIIHDGVLAGKSMTGGNIDPEMVGPYVSQAARDLKLGTFDCRVICSDPDLQSLEQLSAIAVKIVDEVSRRNVARRAHILVFWSFRDVAACDPSWNKIESVVSTEEASLSVDNALKALETIQEVGNVVVVGPGNPVLFGYPASSPKYNELSTRFRVAWEVNVASGVVSYPLELILSGCAMSKWGFLQRTKVNIGRVASRIAYLAGMSTTCGLGHCELSADDAREYISSRSPLSGEKPTLGVDVFSALTGDQAAGSVLPPPPGHAPPPAPAAPQAPAAEAGVLDDDQGDAAAAPGAEARDATETGQDADMPQAGSGAQAANEPPPIGEGDIAKMMEAVLTRGVGRALSSVGYGVNLDDETELPGGGTSAASSLPSQALHPQRLADRVQFGPLGERDARFAQYAPQPTAIAGRGTAHEDRSGVTHTEAREATAAMIRRMVKETTDAERIEALSNVAVDKPATESGARPSSFYPDGSLSVDAATARLSEHKKRADSNSQMMREMESAAYVATLFDRYSGNVISAMDARWVPEYGNRGELEAAIGSVISGLDGAMAQVAHMPVVHPHIPST